VSALRALEQLAIAAEDRAAKIWLCGVNVEVYKVLKLVKLGPRFSFLTEDNGRASSCRN
jgi:anti-anti-sigma regulatory factor